jgi:glucokinase
MSQRHNATILAGDIGGTKTVLALYRNHGGGLEIVTKQQYASGSFPDFSDIIDAFLKEVQSAEIDAACFGIAGPVIGGRCKTTNLPWEIEASRLKQRLSTESIRLLNDLEATAYGMLYLKPSEFVDLNSAVNAQEGNRAVIAAGTGLGEAMLFFDGSHYHPVGSEGGHCDFAPADDQQSVLLSWLHRRYSGHVSYERVLSGPGVYALYEFLRDTDAAPEPAFMKTLAAGEDKSAAVSRGALQNEDPLCHETLKLFARIYGAEAGNLALKSLSVGGILVGGGIAPKILPYLKEYFMESFTAKGRFSELLRNMPVHVSMNPETALLGAAHYAADRLIPPAG